MKIVADREVVELIQQRGGRLYVWTDPHRCCSGGVSYLLTGSAEPVNGRFATYDAEGFELWFDAGGKEVPDELHLDVKGWRNKRVEAYWNGCAFVI